MRLLLRCLVYLWASPYTVAGICIGLLLGGRFQRIDGVIEISGPRIARLLKQMYVPALAMTFGHIVFGQSISALDITRAHERVHVRQYERWGPLFLPAYFIASFYQFARKRDPYRDNPFEVEAYAVDDMSD